MIGGAVSLVALFLILCLIPARHIPSDLDHVRQLVQRWWWFGFDVALQFVRWVNQGIVLQESTKWMEQNGRTFSVNFAGHTNICTADAVNARAVLMNNAKDFEISYVRQNAFRPAVGNGIFAANGPQWAHGRKVLSRALTHRQVRDLGQYETHVQNLFAHLPADGTTIDLRDLLSLFTMDTSTHFLLGESTSWLTTAGSKMTRTLDQAFDYAIEIMRLGTDLGFFVHLHWDATFRRSCKLLHDFVDSYIIRNSNAAIEASQSSLEEANPRIFLKQLVISGSDAKATRDHVLSSLMAGRDTTASHIGFVIWNLARHPKVQQKLRDAIASIESPTFSFRQLSEITYLWWVIKEVLRLYPSVPADDRASNTDTQIPHGGGTDGRQPAFIPAGCIIDIHVWAIHRHRSLWGEDADKFRPERWEECENPIGFMPFGLGPRTCPGQELAMIQTAYLTVRLLQTYSSLESRDKEPFRERVSLSLSSENGFEIALRR
ncbi:uncharacterized protein Z518_05229 [Rhinocladiella mackenziei CBS 650.93]|uniref:Rhinocladiella mackenziei CBS 650.93 unplaced genomic scaffold supercont1.4, whole genome shotgun sequence n=1 Tax=Rhinocladiella mackenziei CBS 650.93 TaxID=1442369 RepID=A0A0D2IMI5_9EURO|nr:uncharacterized protein Z518_05229 [Rhinocladiella mackenziei CBS 650.93]KIX04361.1 hypothetical protein Z518_05229 [Rhinocladiella mackenziei CBS 650.93]